MTAIDRTAYPRPEVRLTRQELGERYHLSDAELAFIHASARGDTGRLLLAMLLKSLRDFRYFPAPDMIHADTAEHLAAQLVVAVPKASADEMRRTKSLYRYQATVRSYLGVKPYGDEAERLVTGVFWNALNGAIVLSLLLRRRSEGRAISRSPLSSKASPIG